MEQRSAALRRITVSRQSNLSTMRLSRGAFIGSSLGISALAAARMSPQALAAAPDTSLVPVRINARRVIRTVVGLRPFRSTGFVLRAEPLGSKLLVHNYGHGGGGFSLSWGCATLAADLVAERSPSRAAVLGCGVIGLTTARILQNRGWQVTIYAAVSSARDDLERRRRAVDADGGLRSERGDAHLPRDLSQGIAHRRPDVSADGRADLWRSLDR